jgi:hypothetical protein
MSWSINQWKRFVAQLTFEYLARNLEVQETECLVAQHLLEAIHLFRHLNQPRVLLANRQLQIVLLNPLLVQQLETLRNGLILDE